MITKEYNLDMVPGGVPTMVHVSQYDNDFTILFHLYARNGSFSIASGSTAEIRGTKKDKNGYSASATLDVSSLTVTVSGDKQMTAIAGEQVFELSISNNGKELNSANFILAVEKAPLDSDSIISDSKIREIADLSQDADEMIAMARNIVSYTESAKSSKDAAAKSASSAADSASRASTSESNASSSAAVAKSNAEVAQTESKNAGTSMNNAANSANAAAVSASAAKSSAEAAAKSASAAAGSASAASDSASNASISAQKSADNASTAQNYAGNAADSATEAAGYRDTALEAATNAAGYAGESEYRLMRNPETGRIALAHYVADSTT